MWTALGTFGLVAFILLLVGISLIILVTMCGLCGACCRSRCCLIFFTIFIFIWMCVLIALGIVAIVIPPTYFSQTDDSKCLKISAFSKLQTFSENAQKSICSSCECYFSNIEAYSASEKAQLAIDAPKRNSVNTGLPVRAQECSGWDSSALKDGNKIYAEFENKFKCTGWCGNTTSLYYHFTNVNNGKPLYTCYNRVSYYVKRYNTVVTILSFVMAGLMLVALFLTICYLCKMGQGGNTPLETQATAQHIVVVDGARGYPPYPPYPYK